MCLSPFSTFASVFFASPDLSVTPLGAVALLLLVGVVPIFIVSALQGITLTLGLFQFAVLCLTELTQWRFTRYAHAWIKIVSAGSTYLIANIIVTVGVMYLASHFPHIGSYFYGK